MKPFFSSQKNHPATARPPGFKVGTNWKAPSFLSAYLHPWTEDKYTGFLSFFSLRQLDFYTSDPPFLLSLKIVCWFGSGGRHFSFRNLLTIRGPTGLRENPFRRSKGGCFFFSLDRLPLTIWRPTFPFRDHHGPSPSFDGGGRQPIYWLFSLPKLPCVTTICHSSKSWEVVFFPSGRRPRLKGGKHGLSPFPPQANRKAFGCRNACFCLCRVSRFNPSNFHIFCLPAATFTAFQPPTLLKGLSRPDQVNEAFFSFLPRQSRRPPPFPPCFR